MDFKIKYLKYKKKYLRLKQIAGGIPSPDLIELIKSGEIKREEAEQIMDIIEENKLNNLVKEGRISEDEKNKRFESYKMSGKMSSTQYVRDKSGRLIPWEYNVPMYLLRDPNVVLNKKLLVLCYESVQFEPKYIKFFNDTMNYFKSINRNFFKYYDISLKNYDVDLVGDSINDEELDLYHKTKKKNFKMNISMHKILLQNFKSLGYLYDIIIEEHCPKYGYPETEKGMSLSVYNLKNIIKNLLKPGGIFIMKGKPEFLHTQILMESDIKNIVDIIQFKTRYHDRYIYYYILKKK
jgi:hypothetical protein